jgi:PKHD-type hydroxylase
VIVPIAGLLSPEDVRAVRAGLDGARWEDGRKTAGHQSAQVKRNEQVVEDDAAGRRAADRVLGALERNPLFISAALPLKVFPPLFNRYSGGQNFGDHVDNAIRQTPQGHSVRTDLSATLFLSAPEEYDGGELVIGGVGGTQSVKLGAGDLVVYPASTVHRVNPVTRGTRLASFFWIQSMVRADARRELLFQLDEAIRTVRAADPHQQALVDFVSVYHNLIRTWAEC